jgi:thiamine transport system permease protein
LIPIAHTLVGLPFVIRIIQPALVSIPEMYTQSAALLGASPWKIWLNIELPILSRAFVSAGIFAFTISIGEFGATTFLSRPDLPTIPIAIYRYLSQPGVMNYGQAMAMATILMVICAMAIFLVERLRLPGISDF